MELIKSLPTRTIAKICNVSPRTVQRWKNGTHRPRPAQLELLHLHYNGRVMPPKWPHGWRFNERSYLDTGHAQALAWQQIDWYFYSIACWHQLLDLIPRIEARLDALARVAPTAEVIKLDKYREELKRLKERPFALPADLREYYQIEPRQLHRTQGC